MSSIIYGVTGGVDMQELSIKRDLNEDTRLQEIVVLGKVYSLHLSRNNEVVIADTDDYSKIYAIYARDFWDSFDGV